MGGIFNLLLFLIYYYFLNSLVFPFNSCNFCLIYLMKIFLSFDSFIIKSDFFFVNHDLIIGGLFLLVFFSLMDFFFFQSLMDFIFLFFFSQLLSHFSRSGKKSLKLFLRCLRPHHLCQLDFCTLICGLLCSVFPTESVYFKAGVRPEPPSRTTATAPAPIKKTNEVCVQICVRACITDSVACHQTKDASGVWS